MIIWWQDQAEYYFVCPDCYERHRGKQWSGSTKGHDGWRERAEEKRKRYESIDGKCEFCGPNGNGGPL